VALLVGSNELKFAELPPTVHAGKRKAIEPLRN
jgi:hypothetical protein